MRTTSVRALLDRKERFVKECELFCRGRLKFRKPIRKHVPLDGWMFHAAALDAREENVGGRVQVVQLNGSA